MPHLDAPSVPSNVSPSIVYGIPKAVRRGLLAFVCQAFELLVMRAGVNAADASSSPGRRTSPKPILACSGGPYLLQILDQCPMELNPVRTGGAHQSHYTQISNFLDHF